MRSRLAITTIAIACAVLAAPDRASAQAQQNQDNDIWFDLREVVSPFTRIYRTGVSLRFTPDAEEDVLFIGGDQLMQWSALESHDSVLALGVHGTDVEILADYAPVAPQAVLVPGAPGLQRARYDSGTFTVDVIGDSSWISARDVETADFFDADGDIDVWGLDADGTKLLRLRRVGSTYVAMPIVNLPATGEQIEAMDVDGDGTPEIGVRYGGGIEVYGSNGVRRFVVPTPLTVAMDGLHDTSAGVDRVALITDDGDGFQTLLIYDGSGGTLLTHGMGNYQAVSCTAADYDSGGVDELFLSLRSNRGMLQYSFTNVTTAPTETKYYFNFSEFDEDGNWDLVADNNATTIVTADLDTDGDIDVVTASNDENVIHVHKNGEVDERTFSPELLLATMIGPTKLSLTFSIPQFPGLDVFQLLVWEKTQYEEAGEVWWEISSPFPYSHEEEDATAYTTFTSVVDLGYDTPKFALGNFALVYQPRLVRKNGSDTSLSAPSFATRVVASPAAMLTLHEQSPFNEGLPQAFAPIGEEYPDRGVSPHPCPPMFP